MVKRRFSSAVNVPGARSICHYPSFGTDNLTFPILVWIQETINLVFNYALEIVFSKENLGQLSLAIPFDDFG